MGRAATVMSGLIVSIREVHISGTNTGVGSTAGAVAGATAGSQIGGSVEANIIGAVGGAVVGGIVGAIAEGALTEAGAVEFIIKQENGQVISVVQINDENLQEGEKILIIRSNKVRIIRDTANLN